MEKPVKPVLNKEKPVSCLKLWNILTGLLLTIGYFGKINFWTIFSKYVFLFIYQSFYVFVSDNLGSGAVWGKSANRGGPRSHPYNPYVPNAPPPYPTSAPGGLLYPSLGDFMGLDITPEFIQTHIVSSKCSLVICGNCAWGILN